MIPYSLSECCTKTHINFYPNFYMFVAHNAFYLACILRGCDGCDMSTVFLYEYEYMGFVHVGMMW